MATSSNLVSRWRWEEWLSGDLLHADRYGAVVTPHEAALLLAEACRKIIRAEAKLIAACKDRGNFSIEGLTESFSEFIKEYPVERPPSM
jgi:hypothetical protein